MRLEILRTYFTMEAKGHKVKPHCMTTGDFTITLDNVSITYTNHEASGGWAADKEIPTIEWECRGGSDIYYVNDKCIGEPEDYILDNFATLPKITKITDVYYEAFTNIELGIEYEFDLTEFAIIVRDSDTREEYTIKASKEVIQSYINKEQK